MNTSSINFRLVLFTLGWAVLMAAIWIHYRDWITYDRGIPLLPWFAVLFGVYASDRKSIKKRIGRGAHVKRLTKEKTQDRKVLFGIFKESFEESWHSLRIELLIIIFTVVFFSFYYLIILNL